jgi:hypothetical protein
MSADLCAFTFLSVHDVLRAEKLLLEAGVKLRLIPVPSQVNPDCGLAVQVACGEVEQARRVLAPLSARVTGCHRLEGAAFTPWEGA